MSPQEKAEELFNKYFSEIKMPTDCEGCMQCVGRCSNMVAIAKKYALITVYEILDASMLHFDDLDSYVNYWQQVKQALLEL